MLECFHECEECSAIGREGMNYPAALIFFIQKASPNQRLSVLGDGFKMRPKLFGDSFNRYSLIFLNRPQNGDAPVIRRAFEITLQLVWCFHTLHRSTGLTIFQHSIECWNIVSGGLGVREGIGGGLFFFR